MTILSKKDFLALIDALRAEVERDGSFEGSIRYEAGDRHEFRVQAFVRTGNDMGQGGAIVFQEKWPDEESGTEGSPDVHR